MEIFAINYRYNQQTQGKVIRFRGEAQSLLDKEIEAEEKEIKKSRKFIKRILGIGSEAAHNAAVEHADEKYLSLLKKAEKVDIYKKLFEEECAKSHEISKEINYLNNVLKDFTAKSFQFNEQLVSKISSLSEQITAGQEFLGNKIAEVQQNNTKLFSDVTDIIKTMYNESKTSAENGKEFFVNKLNEIQKFAEGQAAESLQEIKSFISENRALSEKTITDTIKESVSSKKPNIFKRVMQLFKRKKQAIKP